MTGDSHYEDDGDFLDEDFVVEDLAGKNDELEDLFDAPAQPAQPTPKAADEAPDEDDVLFEDHTAGLQDEVAFQKPTFAEDGANEWDGDSLDLESVGVDANAGAVEQGDLAEAEQTFSDELDSMLSDEEFSVETTDGEVLELGAVDRDDGVSEFDQAGPFVLEDGEDSWSEEFEAEADASAEPVAAGTDVEAGNAFTTPRHAFVDDPQAQQPTAPDAASDVVPEAAPEFEHELAPAAEMVDEFGEPVAMPTDIEDLPLLESTAGDAEVEEEGWEALPGQSVDELSEVDELQPADDDYYDDEEGYEPEFVGADGHDLYVDEADEQAEVVGGYRSRRWAGVLMSLAATLLVVGGAGVMVVRPQWFGLSVEPERVAMVELSRPRLELAVEEPPTLARLEQLAAAEQADASEPGVGGEVGTDAGAGGALAGGGASEPAASADVGAAVGDTTPTEPLAGDAAPVVGAPAEPTTSEPVASKPRAVDDQPVTPAAPVVVHNNPADDTTSVSPANPDVANGGAASPTNPTDAPEASDPVAVVPLSPEGWPVAARTVAPEPTPAESEPMARFGDGLMIVEGPAAAPASPSIDGVTPGSRAFAQLHNGNYFIGQVKATAEGTVTLRMPDGEVTLVNDELVQLTRLGSQDYEALQKVTAGFVRLTNNNRLVGGILSRIADDHVVLEFRKNRVMLPKSVVGEIVQGNSDRSVLLGTTREEENWIRSLAERELGTGRGAELEPAEGAAPSPGAPR